MIQILIELTIVICITSLICFFDYLISDIYLFNCSQSEISQSEDNQSEDNQPENNKILNRAEIIDL